MAMVNDVLREAEGKMKKSVEALRHNLSTIRTGRASPALVEHLPVDAYGSSMPLNQLAGISVPEARLIVIQPYDGSTVKAIEKAIQNSELGINPSNDGRVIRLVIPQLTEERRRDLTKLVRNRVEESKVALRNIRREALDDLRQLAHEKMISEDDQRRGQEKLQEQTDRFARDLDQIGGTKEAEVMEV
jgi:ribosome recycling factor